MDTLRFDGMLHMTNSKSMQVRLLDYGWIIKRNGVEVAHAFGLFLRKCKTGSNIAEYTALSDGLEVLVDLRVHAPVVYSKKYLAD
jgi:hypothetical protein